MQKLVLSTQVNQKLYNLSTTVYIQRKAMVISPSLFVKLLRLIYYFSFNKGDSRVVL
ncbi:hypothetical protein L3i20_v201760 [Paenibacillus sp. L3-i20]|nr:hypothetical protein L3i20_v201760 [Paenibacillus sp. L3-i20]